MAALILPKFFKAVKRGSSVLIFVVENIHQTFTTYCRRGFFSSLLSRKSSNWPPPLMAIKPLLQYGFSDMKSAVAHDISLSFKLHWNLFMILNSSVSQLIPIETWLFDTHVAWLHEMNGSSSSLLGLDYTGREQFEIWCDVRVWEVAGANTNFPIKQSSLNLSRHQKVT